MHMNLRFVDVRSLRDLGATIQWEVFKGINVWKFRILKKFWKYKSTGLIFGGEITGLTEFLKI